MDMIQKTSSPQADTDISNVDLVSDFRSHIGSLSPQFIESLIQQHPGERQAIAAFIESDLNASIGQVVQHGLSGSAVLDLLDRYVSCAKDYLPSISNDSPIVGVLSGTLLALDQDQLAKRNYRVRGVADLIADIATALPIDKEVALRPELQEAIVDRACGHLINGDLKRLARFTPHLNKEDPKVSANIDSAIGNALGNEVYCVGYGRMKGEKFSVESYKAAGIELTQEDLRRSLVRIFRRGWEGEASAPVAEYIERFGISKDVVAVEFDRQVQRSQKSPSHFPFKKVADWCELLDISPNCLRDSRLKLALGERALSVLYRDPKIDEKLSAAQKSYQDNRSTGLLASISLGEELTGIFKRYNVTDSAIIQALKKVELDKLILSGISKDDDARGDKMVSCIRILNSFKEDKGANYCAAMEKKLLPEVFALESISSLISREPGQAESPRAVEVVNSLLFATSFKSETLPLGDIRDAFDAGNAELGLHLTLSGDGLLFSHYLKHLEEYPLTDPDLDMRIGLISGIAVSSIAILTAPCAEEREGELIDLVARCRRILPLDEAGWTEAGQIVAATLRDAGLSSSNKRGEDYYTVHTMFQIEEDRSLSLKDRVELIMRPYTGTPREVAERQQKMAAFFESTGRKFFGL